MGFLVMATMKIDTSQKTSKAKFIMLFVKHLKMKSQLLKEFVNLC
ncbi:MAG: hypothetical protein ACTTIV_02145 [Campylobacter sp.]